MLLVSGGFKATDQTQKDRQIFSAQPGRGLQQGFDAFSRSKQRDRTDRPTLVCLFADTETGGGRDAIGNQTGSVGIVAEFKRVAASGCGYHDGAVRGAHPADLDSGVDAAKQTTIHFRRRLSVQVVHQRDTGQPSCQAGDQCRTGRVRVDQPALAALDQSRQLPGWPQVETRSHRYRMQDCR